MAAIFSRRNGVRTASVAVAAAGVVGALMGTATAADPIQNQNPPSRVAPADQTTTPIKDVVLQWTPVKYATTYQVEISPNGDWTNNLVTLPNNGSTVATTYEVPLSLPHDEYYWRVRAVDAGGTTAWSTSRGWQFLHDWAAPLTILQSPTSADPTIRWAPVPEASLYRVRFSTDPTFPTQGDTHLCWTAATSFTPYTLESSKENLAGDCLQPGDLTAGTSYYYEVMAFDDSTAPVIKSDTANDPNFECAEVQPECDALTIGAVGSFTYAQPAAGTASSAAISNAVTWTHTASGSPTNCDATTYCAATPTFSWSAAPGANVYKLAVFRDPLGSNVYRVYSTQWPTLTPRDTFFDAQAGRAYYWRVYAGTCTVCDGTDTSYTSESPIEEFATSSGAVTLGQVDVHAATVTFHWSDFLNSGGAGAVEVRNYHVQIATDGNFTHVVVDNPDVDMTQWTVRDTHLPDGVYYWRVQGIDESGNLLTWSSGKTFTVNATPPVLRLTNKNGLRLTGHFHVRASESDLAGKVSNSTVHIVKVVGGGKVRGSWQRTSPSSWTFTPKHALTPGQTYALDVVGGISDEGGNPAIESSRTVRAALSAEDKSPALHYSQGWRRHRSSNALGGTYTSTTSGGSVAASVVGSKLSVYGCKAPGLRKLVISVDGHVRARVNEKQSFTKCGVLLWRAPIASTRVHALTLQAPSAAAVDRITVG